MTSPPDLDFNTRCVDSITIKRDAIVLVLRTRRTKWKGNRRSGLDRRSFQIGASVEDLKRILEADTIEALSDITGIRVGEVEATQGPNRVWTVRVVTFDDEGQPIGEVVLSV